MARTKKIVEPTVNTKGDDQERLQALKAAMAQIEKQYGAGSIMRLGESKHQKVDVIPTGSLALDIALGVGGFPKGRIIEIYGHKI